MSDQNYGQVVRHYKRDSFDRFGDDLCEYILQYLSFGDKIRLECVNKRTRKCMFECQRVLNIDRHQTNDLYFLYKDGLSSSKLLSDFRYYGSENIDLRHTYALKRVLTKYRNLNHIIVGNVMIRDTYIRMDHLLRIIADYSNHLLSITFKNYLFREISLNAWQYFGQKCGKTLRRITNDCIGNGYNTMHKYNRIEYFPNLLSIKGVYLSQLINRKSIDKVLFADLREIMCLRGCDEDSDLMHAFFNRYKRIKTIDFRLIYDDCYLVLSHISRLTKLEKLELHMCSEELNMIQFVNGLKQISINKQIKHLSIFFENYYFRLTNAMIKSLLNTINRFSQLKYLKLTFHSDEENYELISVKLLKDCTKLTHLNIIGLVGNHFYADIHQYLPQLTVVINELSPDVNKFLVSDETLNYFLKLKQLKTLRITSVSVTKGVGFSKLLENCLQLKTISLLLSENTTVHALRHMIDAAMQRPRVLITFNICYKYFDTVATLRADTLIETMAKTWDFQWDETIGFKSHLNLRRFPM